MRRYSVTDRIDYYKKQAISLKEEIENQFKQIEDLVKENNQLRCQINVLENKLRNKTEKEND